MGVGAGSTDCGGTGPYSGHVPACTAPCGRAPNPTHVSEWPPYFCESGPSLPTTPRSHSSTRPLVYLEHVTLLVPPEELSALRGLLLHQDSAQAGPGAAGRHLMVSSSSAAAAAAGGVDAADIAAAARVEPQAAAALRRALQKVEGLAQGLQGAVRLPGAFELFGIWGRNVTIRPMPSPGSAAAEALPYVPRPVNWSVLLPAAGLEASSPGPAGPKPGSSSSSNTTSTSTTTSVPPWAVAVACVGAVVGAGTCMVSAVLLYQARARRAAQEAEAKKGVQKLRGYSASMLDLFCAASDGRGGSSSEETRSSLQAGSHHPHDLSRSIPSSAGQLAAASCPAPGAAPGGSGISSEGAPAGDMARPQHLEVQPAPDQPMPAALAPSAPAAAGTHEAAEAGAGAPVLQAVPHAACFGATEQPPADPHVELAQALTAMQGRMQEQPMQLERVIGESCLKGKMADGVGWGGGWDGLGWREPALVPCVRALQAHVL